jgi:hypothetical protein
MEFCMRLLSRASRIVFAGLVTVISAAVLSTFVALRYIDRHKYADRDGCEHVPLAPAFTPQTYGGVLWPYGEVTACSTLDSDIQLLGETTVSFTLLLETESGPVLTRMDYLHIDAGRQFIAEATELDPEATCDLPDADTLRLTNAITARGGLLAEPWRVHYGDG